MNLKVTINSIIAIFFMLVLTTNAQENRLSFNELWEKISHNRPEVYFSFETSGKLIKSLDKTIYIDKVKNNTIFAYANKKSFENFLEFNIDYKILTPPGLTIENPEMKSSINVKEIDDWDFYPTYEAYVDMMYQFETDYPDICKVSVLGTLSSGRKILAAKITDNVTLNEYEPEFFYTATMHGDETAGYILMLRLIDYFLSNYNSDNGITSMVNNLEIWINPLANPDGTYAGGNSTVNGATRGNANGIDLNRNFPDPEDGPHPDGNEWQEETVIFMNFATFHDFNMSSNLHGGAEVCNYPWDTWAIRHADDEWWQFVCHEYADTAQEYSPPGYMSGFNDGITNGYDWYSTSGNRQDYMNYFHSCREFTLEISNTKLVPSWQLPLFWNYNYRSLINYIKQVKYGVKGVITDSITQEAIKAKIYVEDHDIDSSWVFSSLPAGNYHRPINEGTYTFRFSARGYFTKTIEDVESENYQTTVLNVKLAPGTLIADFTSDKNFVPVDSMVSFTDLTYGDPNYWYWTFEGANPAHSQENHPDSILYSEPGQYNVSLKVANENGDTNVITKEYFITCDYEYVMNNSTEYTCSGIFSDPGGSNHNYGNNQDYVMTFIPHQDDKVILAEFSEFNVEYENNCNYDWLKIFDGTGTDDPLIGKYCGTESPGIISADNPEGALTFQFHSDQSETASGWLAKISCDSNVGIANIHQSSKIDIYPNPAKDYVKINSNLAIKNICLRDISGKVLLRKSYDKNSVTINLGTFNKGIYLILIETSRAKHCKKLILIN